MQNFIFSIFDFFLPVFCPSCKQKINSGSGIICRECLDKLKLAGEERILSEYRRKFSSKKIISGFISLYVFEKDKELQRIMHAFKYARLFRVGLFLGEITGEILKEKILSWNIDIIVPVPLHHLKKAERGYNQSEYIAKGLARKLNLPVDRRIIKRRRFTESQTTMTLKEREININGAFAVRNRKNAAGRKILIIDDVITTGSTINECGIVLLDAGAEKIYAASVAIAD